MAQQEQMELTKQAGQFAQVDQKREEMINGNDSTPEEIPPQANLT